MDKLQVTIQVKIDKPQVKSQVKTDKSRVKIDKSQKLCCEDVLSHLPSQVSSKDINVSSQIPRKAGQVFQTLQVLLTPEVKMYKYTGQASSSSPE